MREFKETRLDRLKNGTPFMDIYKEEVAEILNIETSATFFNEELGLFYQNNYYDQIKQARAEKVLLSLPKRYIEIEFNVSRIYSYNELFRDKECRQHNQKYYSYKEEIKRLFKDNDHSGKLSDILKSKYLLIQVEFEVNNRLRDLDNVMKPFLDNLFDNTTNTDNSVKRISEGFIFKNEENNDESIYFRLVELNESDIEFCSIKNSIKNKLK